MASDKNAGVADKSKKGKPVKSKVKPAKYGFYCGKDLSKTKTY